MVVLVRVWVKSQALAHDNMGPITSAWPLPIQSSGSQQDSSRGGVGNKSFGSQKPNKFFFPVSFTSQKQQTPKSLSNWEPFMWPGLA